MNNDIISYNNIIKICVKLKPYSIEDDIRNSGLPEDGSETTINSINK